MVAAPRSRGLLIICLLLCAGLYSRAWAAPFRPGDLLFGIYSAGGAGNPGGSLVLEYSGDSLVQSLTVPPSPTVGSARSLAVDNRGWLQVYNGTFTPSLSSYDPVGNAWTHRTFPGWSTADSGTYGGIAAYRNYVFVTDMITYPLGAPEGLIRFNQTDGTATRFAGDSEFIMLCMGHDGLLYAICTSGPYLSSLTTIEVFNPDTLGLLRVIVAPREAIHHDIFRSLGVNKQGELFLSGLNGVLMHCDKDGNPLQTLDFGETITTNMALAKDGRIAIARADGSVVLTDESLIAYQTFQAYSYAFVSTAGMFVTFVPPRANPDFNNDGNPDLVWQNPVTGDVSYWLMNGTQAVNSGYLARRITPEWQVAGTPDFYGDGNPGLLWQNQITGDVSCWRMRGTNAVSTDYIARAIPLEWKVVGTPDLNHDGKPDLLWQNQRTGDVSYWLMDGIHPLSAGYAAYNIPVKWKITATADLNSDGFPDLLWRDQETGDVSYWLMNGTQAYASGYLAYSIPLEWKLTRTIDLNSDGKPDLLWWNQRTGDVSYWLMDGTRYLSAGYLSDGIFNQWHLVPSD